MADERMMGVVKGIMTFLIGLMVIGLLVGITAPISIPFINTTLNYLFSLAGISISIDGAKIVGGMLLIAVLGAIIGLAWVVIEKAMASFGKGGR